ncbi:MAG: hypothetical protein ACXWR1_07420, partial [Bdellovibrionota bacterium]
MKTQIHRKMMPARVLRMALVVLALGIVFPLQEAKATPACAQQLTDLENQYREEANSKWHTTPSVFLNSQVAIQFHNRCRFYWAKLQGAVADIYAEVHQSSPPPPPPPPAPPPPSPPSIPNPGSDPFGEHG